MVFRAAAATGASRDWRRSTGDLEAASGGGLGQGRHTIQALSQPMKITNFICCEYAVMDVTGRITLVSAGLDVLVPKKFPAELRFFFYVRIGLDPGDLPAVRIGTLKLIGEDERHGTMEVPFKLLEGSQASN